MGHRLRLPRRPEGAGEEGPAAPAHAHRHARLRHEHPPADLPGRAGAARARAGVRFRMGQQEPVLRRVHPDAELLQQQRPRAQLPPDIFTKPFTLPVTDASGDNREQLRAALSLLDQAGWKVKDRKLVNAAGQPFSFEILLDQPAFERVALPYVQWLAKLGIEARVRTV